MQFEREWLARSFIFELTRLVSSVIERKQSTLALVRSVPSLGNLPAKRDGGFKFLRPALVAVPFNFASILAPYLSTRPERDDSRRIIPESRLNPGSGRQRT